MCICKNSIKTILRSNFLVLAVIFLLFVSVHSAITRTQGYYDSESGELITNRDPRFVMTYDEYIQLISNTCSASVMLYAMPVFAVVTTVTLIAYDYRSSFFEVEKSRGISVICYVLSRLTVLILFNTLAMIIAVFTSFHLYIFISGGVDGMIFQSYIIDSTVKLLRYIFAVCFPTLVLYISLTYCAGCILKSSLGAGVAGLGYILMNYLFSYQLRFKIPQVYHSYLSPAPNKLRYYFHCLGSQKFENALQIFDTSKERALHCIIILFGASFTYLTLSLYFTHKRNK